MKLIIFDLEGTIFKKTNQRTKKAAPSAWTLLAKATDKEKEEEKTVEKWCNGEYENHFDWTKESLEILRPVLTKEIFDTTLKSIPYNKRVKETIKELKKQGYITAIISGGFKAQADKAQSELLIDHSFAACDIFWKDNKIHHYNLLPSDYEGKVDFMKLLKKEYNANIVFIGDGINDVPLAKAADISFSFDGPEELDKAATHKIKEFSELLEYL